MSANFEQYLDRLRPDEIRDEMSKTASRLLSLKFGFEVDAHFDDNNGVDIWGYKPRGVGLDAIIIKPSEIEPKVIRQIISATNKALIRRIAIEENKLAKLMIRRISMGQVVRTCADTKEVHIQVGGGSLKGWIGRMPVHNQPIKERGSYGIGQVLWLYVENVRLNEIEGIYQNDVVLSRTSTRLAESLVRHFTFNETGDDLSKYHIKCHKRIPGAWSLLSAKEKVPIIAIQQAREALNENVTVLVTDGKETSAEIIARFQERRRHFRMTQGQNKDNKGQGKDDKRRQAI